MTDIRLEVVDLLIDCANFGAETYGSRTLEHEDGRPFTEAEYELVGSATVAEVRAMVDFSHHRTEMLARQVRYAHEVVRLCQPYWDRFGPDTTLGDVYQLMPADQRAQLVEALQLSGQVER